MGDGKIKEMAAKYDAMEIELSSIQNKNGKLNKSINILKKKVERFQKQTKKLKEENKELKQKKKANAENEENENDPQPVRRSSRKKTRAAFKPLSGNKKISSDEDSDIVTKPTHRYQLRSSSKKRKRSREIMERENNGSKASALRNKIQQKKKKKVDDLLLNSVEPTKK